MYYQFIQSSPMLEVFIKQLSNFIKLLTDQIVLAALVISFSYFSTGLPVTPETVSLCVPFLSEEFLAWQQLETSLVQRVKTSIWANFPWYSEGIYPQLGLFLHTSPKFNPSVNWHHKYIKKLVIIFSQFRIYQSGWSFSLVMIWNDNES